MKKRELCAVAVAPMTGAANSRAVATDMTTTTIITTTTGPPGANG